MAEEAPQKFEIDPWAKLLFGIIIAIVGLVAIFSGDGIFDIYAPESNTIEDLENRNKGFSIEQLIGRGDLELNKNVVSFGDIQVRRDPGGQILGLQERLRDGKIIDGPVEAFRTVWWRINFEKAPSGWVEEGDITSRVGIAKTIYFPQTFYTSYKPIGWVLAILLLIIVIIIKLAIDRENKIANKKVKVQDEQVERKKESEADDVRNIMGLPTEEDKDKYKNQRWEHIQDLMKSNSQNDWRQAIIEADIILDEMLRRMSYDGLTIGDMLKTVDRADFATLDKAWEAHKFRNEIAHTGSEFKISRDEAERVIELFKSVFDEFYFI
jgi:hypothetical protein